jgi:hypothetical protein
MHSLRPPLIPWKIKPMKKMNNYLVAFALSNFDNAFHCYTRQYRSFYCWNINIIALVQNTIENISIVISLQSLAEKNPQKGKQ